MEDAGMTLAERIEQKLSNLNITVNNSDIKEAARQIDARIEANPDDMESRLIRLELKVVELSRFLDATLGALDHGAAPIPQEFMPAEEQAPAKYVATDGGKRPMKRRLNSATGVIEEVEDTGEDNVIVADGRRSFGGGRGGSAKEEKKCVFISATDDEPVPESAKKRK